MKTSKNITIESLVEAATKMGHNAVDARQVVAKNFEYVTRQYPSASAKKLVSISYMIY